MRNLIAVAVLAAMAACGRGPAASTGPGSPSDLARPPERDKDDPPPTAAAPPGHTALAASAAAPIPLERLQGKPGPGAEKSFPKATTKDKDCTSEVGLMGRAATDYDAVLTKCGAPTGLKEYVKRVSGTFEPGHPSDTYAIKMVAGLCYRFFAVADRTITHLDVRVQRPNGAMLSIAHANEPVLILDSDRAWCKHHDRDYHIVIQTDRGARGQYVFGVWARPDTK